MKKLFLLIICSALVLSLVACGGNGEDISKPDRPPAFSVLQKQTKLQKRAERGENASFSETEFRNFLGEDFGHITVTALPDAAMGTLVFNGSSVMQGQSLPSAQLGFLKFIPSSGCSSAVFRFSSDCAGYFGNEFECVMVFGEGVNSPPVVADSIIKTVSGIPCEGDLNITEPNGDNYTVNVITYPTEGEIKINTLGKLVYIPDEGFYGKDKMVFTVTDRFGAVSPSTTLTIEVGENAKNLCFEDMKDNYDHIYAHRMCNNDTMIYRVSDGKYYFDPETVVSKMEFLVMAMNVVGLDADITAVADSAVKDDDGLSSGMKGYLSAATEKGLIKLKNGKFSPKSEITVSEASYIICESLGLPKVSANTAAADGEDVFSAVSAVVSAGILDPNDGSLEAGSTLTKSDVARILCRIEDYMADNNMVKSRD